MTWHGVRRRNVSRATWVVMIACVGAVWSAGEARGQMPDPTRGSKPDPIMINGQLKLVIVYAEQAIGVLQSAASSEDVKRAGGIAMRAYLQLNAAVHGVELMLVKRTFPDPLLEQTKAIINRAREVNSSAHTRIQWAAASEHQRGEYSVEAIELLRQVIVLVQQAADFL